MSTALTTQTDDELLDVLSKNLYPGADFSSVQMVLGYCRAAGLDPMQKPVHIMSVYAKTGTKDNKGKDNYANRDVVMPGIGLYRVQASRTGSYAGIDPPVFGPDETMPYRKKLVEWVNNQKHEQMVDRSITYPSWCEVTVYRVVAGHRCAYTAREYWMENYATAGKDSDAPNAMWTKRPRGQLAKCAEAQALRKAFPEVGSQPTAEEMEGRDFDINAEFQAAPTPTVQQIQMPQPIVADELVDAIGEAITPTNRPKDDAALVAAMKDDTGELASAGERAHIVGKINASPFPEKEILDHFGMTSFDALTKTQFVAIRDYLRAA